MDNSVKNSLWTRTLIAIIDLFLDPCSYSGEQMLMKARAQIKYGSRGKSWSSMKVEIKSVHLAKVNQAVSFLP